MFGLDVKGFNHLTVLSKRHLYAAKGDFSDFPVHCFDSVFFYANLLSSNLFKFFFKLVFLINGSSPVKIGLQIKCMLVCKAMFYYFFQLLFFFNPTPVHGISAIIRQAVQ